MQQAARISDYTAFFMLGEILEAAPTADLFNNPQHEKTEAYVSGRFG
jgi:phosphate transport system ATP-binding protein